MLPSVESPHTNSSLHKNGPHASPDNIRAVVEGIQRSLFVATLIIKDDPSCEHSPVSGGHGSRNEINFECGRLKFSHVKGEWSVIHRPIHKCGDNMEKLSKSKSPGAKVIAGLLPVFKHTQCVPHDDNKLKSSRCVHNNISSKGRKQAHSTKSRGKDLDNETSTVGDETEHFDSIPSDEVDCIIAQSAITKSMRSLSAPTNKLEDWPRKPPLGLVRCLLNGAEFISMMKCARREIELSMCEMKHAVNANGQRRTKTKGKANEGKAPKARLWSRRLTKNLKHTSINLQPVIVALAGSTIGTNSPLSKPSPLSSLHNDNRNDRQFEKASVEAIMIKFIDECIRLVHIHTMDLIAPWASHWNVRANLRSEEIESNTDDENRSSSIDGRESFAKFRFISRLGEKGTKKTRGNCKSSTEATSFETITTIHEFVMACLTIPRERILQSKTVMEDSKRKPSNTINDFNYSNYSCELCEGPTRNTASRRSKAFTREPADSLVATCMKQNQNPVSPATKHLSVLVDKDSLKEKQRLKRMRYNCHISPSSSVLENTATVASQAKSIRARASQSHSGSKRKRPDSSLLQIKGNQSSAIERFGIGTEQHLHDTDCLNKGEVLVDKETMSPNSLYILFEEKSKRSRKKAVTCKAMKSRDSMIHVATQQNKETDWDRTPRSRTRRQLNGMPTNSMVALEAVSTEQRTENGINWNENGRQQSTKPIDSLHGISKASRSISTSLRSLDDKSLGSERFYWSKTSSSKKNALEANCIGGRVQRRKLIKAESRSSTSDQKRLNQPIPVEECMESANESFDGKPFVDEKEAVVNIMPRNKILFEADESEVPHAKIKHSKDQERTTSKLNENLCDPDGSSKAIKIATGLPWVNLSHIGHVSDYHGYKRKYEHFAPLHFGHVADVRRQIERTLIENRGGNDAESDEEVIKDNNDYNEAIGKYEELAEQERQKKRNCKNDTSQIVNEDALSDMIVLFSTPEVDDNFPSRRTNSSIESYTVNTFHIDELSTSHQLNRFRFIDDEDEVILSAGEDKSGSQRKRISRSAQIAHQKKTSIRMLKEILHTLDFIQKYNSKSRGTAQESMFQTKNEDVNDEGKNVGSSINISERKSDPRPNGGKGQGSPDNSLGTDKLEFIKQAAFPTLDVAPLLKPYDTLRKAFSLLDPLNGQGDIEALKKEIQSILDQDNLLHEFWEDNEIIAEEKILARCIRGYSSKADQEKIEKRDFEERQKLRQHEFEYYYRLRKKKKSPHEIEWKEISSRPIQYVEDRSSLVTEPDDCDLKPNCKICRPILEVQCHENNICSPKFRTAEIKSCIPSEIEPYDDSVWNPSSNVIPPSKRAKLISLLNLSELYHTLNFVNNYNNGLMISSKGRK